MKKRIAWISEHQSPLVTLGGVDAGGQVVYVDKLTKQLAQLGYEIDIFTRWEDKRLPHIVDCHNGVRVIHVPAGPISYIRKEDILQYMPQFTKFMLNYIQETGISYSLIHANFFMSGMVAADIKKALGIPFIITFHALGKIRRLHQGKDDEFSDDRFAIEERVVREADAINAECPQDKEDLIIHYRANPDKISVVPCGFDQNEFYPIDKRLARMTAGLPPEDRTILQLGRMVPRKGVDTVIKALAIVNKSTDLNVRLVIVGGDSEAPSVTLTPEIGRLQDLARSEKIGESVTFTGRRNRDQLKYFYNAADIFISVPWYEPFGITPLESMACGTPVIGSKVGGIKFSVVDGKTGFLIPPKDPEALAEKIIQCYTEPELLPNLSSNAIKRVNTFFTWETVAQSMSSLYEKVLGLHLDDTLSFEDQVAIVDTNFTNFLSVVKKSQEQLHTSLIDAATVMSNTLRKHGKILVAGNGGSATDAQHFAGELVGRFILSHRSPLPVLSLTSDSSILTSVGNDFGFDEVFSQQVEAYGQPDDVLLAISTSGNSENLIEACKKASEKGLITIALLGKDGGEMKDLCDLTLIVPSMETARVQEIHTHLVHTLCELIERQLFPHLAPPLSTPQVQIGIKFGKATTQSFPLVKPGKKGNKNANTQR